MKKINSNLIINGYSESAIRILLTTIEEAVQYPESRLMKKRKQQVGFSKNNPVIIEQFYFYKKIVDTLVELSNITRIPLKINFFEYYHYSNEEEYSAGNIDYIESRRKGKLTACINYKKYRVLYNRWEIDDIKSVSSTMIPELRSGHGSPFSNNWGFNLAHFLVQISRFLSLYNIRFPVQKINQRLFELWEPYDFSRIEDMLGEGKTLVY